MYTLFQDANENLITVLSYNLSSTSPNKQLKLQAINATAATHNRAPPLPRIHTIYIYILIHHLLTTQIFDYILIFTLPLVRNAPTNIDAPQTRNVFNRKTIFINSRSSKRVNESKKHLRSKRVKTTLEVTFQYFK